jgi:hypothetical protein
MIRCLLIFIAYMISHSIAFAFGHWWNHAMTANKQQEIADMKFRQKEFDKIKNSTSFLNNNRKTTKPSNYLHKKKESK